MQPSSSGLLPLLALLDEVSPSAVDGALELEVGRLLVVRCLQLRSWSQVPVSAVRVDSVSTRIVTPGASLSSRHASSASATLVRLMAV